MTTFDPYPSALASCRRCPRLAAHREAVAARKRRAYLDDTYWGAPVPGFGDPAARIVLVGLAPGAHGSNRTGRMFTGDASGDFLYGALYRAGLASAPVSRARGDGLVLHGLWITAVARCVPPGNKPTPAELDACRSWLAHDLDALGEPRVLLALGKIAHDGVLKHYRARARAHGLALTLARHPFAHGALHRLEALRGAPTILDAYHPSFQNTNTGRLTAAMFDQVLATAKRLVGPP